MNCQAVGCNEFAASWGTTLDYGTVEIHVYLCRRHEREALFGIGNFVPIVQPRAMDEEPEEAA